MTAKKKADLQKMRNKNFLNPMIKYVQFKIIGGLLKEIKLYHIDFDELKFFFLRRDKPINCRKKLRNTNSRSIYK